MGNNKLPTNNVKKRKKSIKQNAKHLVKIYNKGKKKKASKYFKKLHQAGDVFVRLCKMPADLELVKSCYKMLNKCWGEDLEDLLYAKTLAKKKKRLPILPWYMDTIIKEEVEDEEDLADLIDDLFPDLKYALRNNKPAFDVMADKLGMKQNSHILRKFIKYVPKDLKHEALKLDINGTLQYRNGKIVDILEPLKKITNPADRIIYIIEKLNFKYTEFDPDRFDECCICLNRPIDVVVGSCGHYNCAPCFFKVLRNNKMIKCQVCMTMEINGIPSMEYSWISVSMDDDIADIQRYNNMILVETNDGNAMIYPKKIDL